MSKIDEPIGVPEIDRGNEKARPELADFVVAASEYVLSSSGWTDSLKKKAQLRLSYILAKVVVADLHDELGYETGAAAGETTVGGGLRSVNADVSEFTEIDGLRLAVEIKPINLAVGRAIWNRFGDIRTFAVNLHLKFPFAVVAGILTVPVFEIGKTKDGETRKATTHLIQRAEKRLVRSGNREHEGEAAHLLEAVGLVVFDPDTKLVDPDIPEAGNGLRWEEFIGQLAAAYEGRFGE
ncbi:MAG: hypothetical protein JW785_03020 [Acidimicrobiia bacterium]|nr:hypothetical protein [Acidimicrobiia bacterium]